MYTYLIRHNENYILDTIDVSKLWGISTFLINDDTTYTYRLYLNHNNHFIEQKEITSLSPVYPCDVNEVVYKYLSGKDSSKRNGFICDNFQYLESKTKKPKELPDKLVTLREKIYEREHK